MRVCASVSLLLTCGACAQAASSAGSLQVGEGVTATGTVVDRIDDCAFDGICAYMVDTDRGQLTAIWAEGAVPCAGRMDQNIALGDAVDIHAVATAAQQVSMCGAPDSFIQAHR